MRKILDESLFEDIEFAEEPQEGDKEFGISDLLMDAIKDEFDIIQFYNTIIANSESYPEIKGIIENIAKEENEHVGQLQAALQTVSENAVSIDDGADKAEGQLDAGSPVDESMQLNEATNIASITTLITTLLPYIAKLDDSLKQIFASLDKTDIGKDSRYTSSKSKVLSAVDSLSKGMGTINTLAGALGNDNNEQTADTTESLSESYNVNASDLSLWMQKQIRFFKENPDYTSARYDLDDELAVFIGWSNGYDEDDDFVMHAPNDPKWGLCAKIAEKNPAEWEFDFFNMPMYDENEVWDTTCELNEKDNCVWEAEYLINEYEKMQERDNMDEELISEALPEPTKKEVEDATKETQGFAVKIITGNRKNPSDVEETKILAGDGKGPVNYKDNVIKKVGDSWQISTEGGEIKKSGIDTFAAAKAYVKSIVDG